nr:syntaxin-51 [Quercus suber]
MPITYTDLLEKSLNLKQTAFIPEESNLSFLLYQIYVSKASDNLPKDVWQALWSVVVLVPYVISKFYLLLHKYDLVSITIKFPKRRSMAASADSWVKEYNEAVKLADDINGMISERSSLPATGPDAQRHASSIRRKITILGTRLDSLQSLLSKIPGKQPITEKEMNRRKDNLANLRSKVNQMASTLNMSNFANRDSLIGPEIKPADAVSRTVGLDNSGLVGLQRQVMKEQDEDLEKLEVTVVSTKHIALAVNEELDLHTRLIDDLDQHVDVTDSRLRRVQKNLAILNKRTKGGCSCMCLLLSVIGIVVLVAVIYLLIKYL